MSFFAKGQFNIEQSWNKNKTNAKKTPSRQGSRDKDKKNAFLNVGKNIIEPSMDLLDDELSKKILKEFAAEMPSSIKAQKKSNKVEQMAKLPPKQKTVISSSNTQNDLLTSMASRLQKVQITCKNQRQQIRQKMETLEQLKAENIFLKGFREDSSLEFEKMTVLKQQNDELKKKVQEMQAYLKKYGLKWVGNKIQGKLQHENIKKQIKKSQYNYRLPSQIDINTIIRRIDQLNGGLQSEGMGTEIYQQNGVHKFKKADPLPIGFFADGIAIKGYKFFPYNSKQSLQILGDLTDGYFPYVLKHKFPNGVFLKVVDKIGEKYNQQSSNQTINTFLNKDNNDFKAPSKEQFLSKLPKQIIKNGKVINIRGEIQKRLNGQVDPIQEQNQVTSEFLQKIQGASIFKTKAHQNLQQKAITQNQVCILKIRNQTGQIYILQLQKVHQVKEIYKWMQMVTKQPFIVMSNYPRQNYEKEDNRNLEQLGFYPNAMLHIQTKTEK